MKTPYSLTKYFFSVYTMGCIWLSMFVSSVFAQETVSTVDDILTHISKEPRPRESLVQWYYAIDDLTQAVQTQAPQSSSLTKLNTIRSALRKELDRKKSLLIQTSGALSLLSQYRDGMLTRDRALEKNCTQQYTIADDRSYALDLPTSLVIATWLMESGCAWSRPSNGDGIFQIVSKDYGAGLISTGHRIWMMYDFNDFVRAKFAWYQKANNLTGSLPFSYQHIDYDSVVKFGALYNGLAGGTVRGTIYPAAPNYVFGKLNDDYSSAVKDGLLVRILKVLKYKW